MLSSLHPAADAFLQRVAVTACSGEVRRTHQLVGALRHCLGPHAGGRLVCSCNLPSGQLVLQRDQRVGPARKRSKGILRVTGVAG